MLLRIATLNTWQEKGPWRERWELIFSGLKSYAPDMIGFQEVFNMEWADEIQKRSDYPYLTKSGAPSGLVFLSKFPVLESECITYKTKSPSEDYLRYAHFALFQIEKKKLAGFNTHLSWMLKDDDIRLNQTQELISFVNKKSGEVPAFVMGDFNSASNKPSVQAVQGMWEDTYAVLNPGNPGLTWDYRNPFPKHDLPERRIDYIWTKGLKDKAKRSEIVFNQPNANGVFPSDHFGVMTEIEI